MPRSFITGEELSGDDLAWVLDRAWELKQSPGSSRALGGRTVALIFERPSTRTRVSFEAGIAELGGHPAVLRPEDLQLSRGESVRDTALVLSRHVAAIGVRTVAHETLEELVAHAEVPVFNMLTPSHHPCQALADLMTLREAFGELAGLRVAFVGDATNVARSLVVLGGIAGMQVALASPEGYSLDGRHATEGHVSLHSDPREAVAGARAVYTDVWVSMGDEESARERRVALAPYQVDDALLDAAGEGAIALHCLPAHPGEEITAAVLYGTRERIWEQAENRRHAQKALLEWLLQGSA